MDAPVGRIVQMFTMRFRDLFGSDGVSCVKLPAAVAFPTDDRLLQRIEESRRALPANNMKPLWRSRELAPAPVAPSARSERGVTGQSVINVSLANVERFPARVTFPQAAHIVDVDVEVELPAGSHDAARCVVPLAR